MDSLDDKTKKPVDALSMTDAVVLSINTVWKPGSNMRGGKYVWLYNPADKKILYYAHLNEIFVRPGQLVKAGETIGTVGRSGFLAGKVTSPSHIHLMVLSWDSKDLISYDYIDELNSTSNFIKRDKSKL